MSIIKSVDEYNVHQELNRIIIKIHKEGPIHAEELECLAHIKYYYPSEFSQYEQKIIYILGVFYKAKQPADVFSLVYASFKEQIRRQTNHYYTPSQASIYLKIHGYNVFSFSAPTSTGKSHLFRDLLREEKRDVVIVVPSRALIAEYLISIRKTFQKTNNILVLDHIDNVNINNTLRRIFVVTPERATEIFKKIHDLNIDLFLFDEAQISEEEKRGIKFDALVRRILLKFPEARKVFAHPFIDNPQAQLSKHHIRPQNSAFQAYHQNTVGKIFLSLDSKKDCLYAFSPYEQDSHLKKHQSRFKSDIIENIISQKGCILIYVSKKSIYEGKIRSKFSRYIGVCVLIDELAALEIIKKIQEEIGSEEIYSEFIELLKYGIVIHHGSIPLRVRFLIEKFISQGFARICFATSTLLQGINLPFDAVIIDSFRFSRSPNNTASLDLKNLIGRSGRSQVSKINSFDYGFVIIKNNRIRQFVEYLNSSSRIDPISQLDKQDKANEENDEDEFIESIKSNTINDEFGLPESQVNRLTSPNIEQRVAGLLDLLFVNNKIITGKEYRDLHKTSRSAIKTSLAEIFETSLKRKLLRYERSVLSTAITILLWKIQNKTFRQVVILRYNYLRRQADISSLERELKEKEISETEFADRISKLSPPVTPAAAFLPNKIKFYNSLYDHKSKVTDIKYDVVVFDTYDYLDKVISISLSDKFIVAFTNYYDKHKDIRADAMVKYLKYGTNDPKEIMLLRYGFSFEDIAKISDCIDSATEKELLFNSTVDSIEDIYLTDLISRYR